VPISWPAGRYTNLRRTENALDRHVAVTSIFGRRRCSPVHRHSSIEGTIIDSTRKIETKVRRGSDRSAVLSAIASRERLAHRRVTLRFTRNRSIPAAARIIGG
jgi:hypothetical protein